MVFTNQCRQGCHLHHQHHHILITISMTLIIITSLMLSIYLGAAAKPKHSSRTIRAGPWRCRRAQVSREVPHQVIVDIIIIIIIIRMKVPSFLLPYKQSATHSPVPTHPLHLTSGEWNAHSLIVEVSRVSMKMSSLDGRGRTDRLTPETASHVQLSIVQSVKKAPTRITIIAVI